MEKFINIEVRARKVLEFREYWMRLYGVTLEGGSTLFMEVKKMTNFLSINKAAESTGIPTSTLRRWLAEGRLPGFYSGSWYYVNCDELDEMISAGVFALPREGARK